MAMLPAVNQRMGAEKIAQFTCTLLTDAAEGVDGQIIGVRNIQI